MGITGAALARPCGHMGRRCRRQPFVHQRDSLDIAHWRSVAGSGRMRRGGFAAGAIWEALLETLIDEPDYEWLMIDARHGKVHPHAAGAKGGNQEMSRTKGGSTPKDIWPWMRLVCRSESLSRKVPERIARKLAT